MNTNDQSYHPSQKFRIDIQALRGVAILTVLLYHAKTKFMSAGYLGVDVFFVISGFLITSLVRDGIEAQRFTLKNFYFRRAKRLLPAAYTTFLFTILIAPFFLTVPEMRDFVRQVIGAVTFTANLVLKRQSGYFDGAAELKPLLHTWSLSIEEQYYLLLPACLLLVPSRFWRKGAFAAFIISLAAGVVLSRRSYDAYFYLLPSRGWELMAGSIGALMPLEERGHRFWRIAFWPALIALVALPMKGFMKYRLDLGAFFICLSTLIIIIRKHPALSRGRVISALSVAGDISYPLYLVHWPLFAMVSNTWVAEKVDPPMVVRLSIIAISFVLAYALHRFIEKPIHLSTRLRPTPFVTGTLAASLGLMSVAVLVSKTSGNGTDYGFIRRSNVGFSTDCNFRKERMFQPLPECRNADEPETLIWGDSFAMHLVPGIAEKRKVIQATRSSCGPLMDLALQDKKDSQQDEKCIEFNDSVLEYLKNTPSIKTVVLSSRFDYYLDKEKRDLLKRENGTFKVTECDSDEVVEGFKATVEKTRALGKKVVVVGPPPSEAFDPGRCLERLETGLITFGQTQKDCQYSYESYRSVSRPVIDLISVLPSQANVDVIGFDDFLCSSGTCKTKMDGVFIYGYRGHLSYDGSRYLAEKTKLAENITRKAR